MGHQGSAGRKIESIEYLDERVIGRVVSKLEEAGMDFRLLVMPDHPTPICKRTHTADPIPYMLYDSTEPGTQGLLYNEETGKNSGIYIENGYTLIDRLFEK